MLLSAVNRLPRRSLALSAQINAPFSTDTFMIATGLSLILNCWQHIQLQKYRSAQLEFAAREREAANREELFKNVEEHLRVQLEALTQKALIRNNESFLNLAKHSFSEMQNQAHRDLEQTHTDIAHIVGPLQKSLEQVESKMDSLEKERAHSFTDLRRQVVDLISTQKELRAETASLVKALRSPTGRGQWGEMQLQRVIEMAGMVEHCDYVQQKGIDSNSGLRPDVVVKLTGNRCIVVDAKTPLLSYLEAYDCPDEAKKKLILKDHARHLKTHINNLSLKGYWSQLENSPDFVVMFIPGEAILAAALAADPTLLEYGVERRVMLATPTTLISLLRIVALGWGQQTVAENTKEIAALGREFYKRLSDFAEHFDNAGKHLTSAVVAYNQSVGSFEKRVLVSARRFQQLDPGMPADSGGPELPLTNNTISVETRQLKSRIKKDKNIATNTT